MRRPIQMLGFSLAAFLCVALAVLKLTSEVHWSWWRVLLPLWLVLGHNILYVTVGFVWIYLAAYGAKGEEATIRQDHDPYGYQLGAMLCFFIFLDNLLKQMEGPRDIVWFGLSLGRWGLILVFGVLSVLCQLLFWSDVVRRGDRGTRGE
jgi:hypothetical protein